MNIKLKLLNNYSVTVLTHLQIKDLIQTALAWSDGVLLLQIDPMQTNFTDIPYDFVGNAVADSENPSGLAATAIDFTWYTNNPEQFIGHNDGILLAIADADWKGDVNGLCHYTPNQLPVQIQLHLQDQTEELNLSSTGHYEFTWLAMHEIRHMLCAIGYLNDDTHAFLTAGKLAESFTAANLNYAQIETNLKALQATQVVPPIVYPVPSEFGSWPEGFSAAAQAAIEANPDAKNQVINGFVGSPYTV